MTRRRLLVGVAAVLALLSLWAALAGSGIPDAIVDLKPGAARSDQSLYDRIVERVSAGDSYYTAAVQEQAEAGYPASPPPVVRLPTTTWVVAVGGDAAPWLLRGLIALTALVAMFRFERIAPTRIEWVLSVLLLAGCLGVFAHPKAVLSAESWASCLIALSLLLHRSGRYRWSVGLGLAAVLFRELAAPYLAVMALMAWRRDRREAVAWLTAIGTLLVAYAGHWALAARAATGVDAVEGPGWITFGGWPQVVDTFGYSTILRPLPQEWWIVLLPLAILGWIVIAGDYRDHVLAVSLGFIVLFMVAGRPDTAYWGRLYVPLLLPGLAFAPRAIITMMRGERRAELSARVAA